MTDNDKYGRYAISKINNTDNDITAIKIELITIREAITEVNALLEALTAAGFTPEELVNQLKALENIEALSSLRDYASEINTNSSAHFLDLVLSGREIMEMSTRTGKLFNTLITSGVLRIGNAINLNGVTNYTRTSSTSTITTMQVGANVNVSIETTPGSGLVIVPFHSVIDNTAETDVTPYSLFLTYRCTGGGYNVRGYYMVTDIISKTVVVTPGPTTTISTDVFEEFMADLPFGVSASSPFIPNYIPEPEVAQAGIFREFGTDELFHVFREYITHVSERMGRESLAASYGQAAVSALATTNGILNSTIVRTSTTYDFSGNQVMSLSFADGRVRVTGFDTFDPYSERNVSPTNRYYPIRNNQTSNPIGFPQYTQTNKLFRYNYAVQSFSEGLDRYAKFATVLRQGAGSIGVVKVSRITDVGTAEIDCEFTPEPLDDLAFTSAPVAFCGYINPDNSTESVRMEYLAGGRTNWSTGNNAGYGTVDVEYMMVPAPTNPLALFAVGSMTTITTPTQLRVRLDASRILEVGSSTTIEMSITGTYNGASISGITVMTRRYVNDGGTAQRLVYEGFIAGPSISTKVLLGFQTELVSIQTPKQSLNWYNSVLNTRDPLWDPNYNTIVNGALAYRTYITSGGRAIQRLYTSNSISTSGQDPCLVPIVDLDTNISGNNYLYLDLTTGNHVPVLTPYNYPSKQPNMIVIGRSASASPLESFTGTYPVNVLNIGDQWPTVFNGTPANVTIPNFGTVDSTGDLVIPAVLQNIGGVTDVDVWLHYQNPVYHLIMPIQNVVITSISVSDVVELSLPIGVYSNTELREDTINIWNTVQLLMKYAKDLQESVNDLTTRVTMIEDTLPRIIDAIKALDENLRNLVESLNPQETPWGIAGGILNFLSTAVGMFFPLVGTAIGVLGQLVLGVGQMTDGDVSNGVAELAVGSLAAGLGLYKFGKRVKDKYRRGDDIQTSFDITNKVSFGTKVKTPTPLRNSTYRDDPPSYDQIYPDSTSRHLVSYGKVKTTDLKSRDDGSGPYVESNSVVLDTHQPASLNEYSWLRSRLPVMVFDDDDPSGITMESQVVKRFDAITGEQTSITRDFYVNMVADNTAYRVLLTDTDFQINFSSWPSGGVSDLCVIRDAYCDLGSNSSLFPFERDILVPLLMSHGGAGLQPITMQKYELARRRTRIGPWTFGIQYASTMSVDVLTQVLSFATNPGIPYYFIRSTDKDSPASRTGVDRMISFWQENDLSSVLTDVDDV